MTEINRNMITRTAPTWQTENWQKALASAIRDPGQLLTELDLPLSLLPAARRAADQFPLRVTRSYLARIEKGNLADPLLRQVLPLADELAPQPDYVADPVGDLAASPLPGLLHKYQGRVLLMVTGACAIHCRYCFRRHYPYSEGCTNPGQLKAALDYIQADPTIDEVILSGGDPLSLANQRLLDILNQLSTIPHIQRLRIHTRLPVVLPERIEPGLLNGLSALTRPVVMVLHINHANELNESVIQQLQRLREAGITLLNQSVLLQGVNDDVKSLKQLSQTLFAAGILPYYLHQLDRVSGAHHFAVSKQQALQLHETLRGQLPGYLLPKLVEEIPGEAAKSPLAL